MLNFNWQIPTKFIFGRGAESHAGEELKALGGTRALIHYGGGSVIRSGLMEKVTKSLDEAGVSYVLLGGAVPNPRDTKVYEGIDLARREKCDCVLAVGGGSAIDSAKANAARMGEAVAARSRFFCADAGKAASQLAAEGLHPDVIVLDPPRKGCDEATLSAVVAMSPRRVVYVSCNPSTAARDAKWLETQGYRTEKVQPVDLFPRTKHCECVIALSKGEIDSKKVRVKSV